MGVISYNELRVQDFGDILVNQEILDLDNFERWKHLPANYSRKQCHETTTPYDI